MLKRLTPPGIAPLGIALLGIGIPALAEDGPYLQMGLAAALAPGLKATGSDNDWSTPCDLVINPEGLEVTDECDAAPGPSEWSNAFGGSFGVGSGIALGLRRGAWRLEGEYLHRATTYDQRDEIAILDDVTLDKQEQEIERAVGGLDQALSHHLFANLYRDFAAGPALTAYAGAGVGLADASLYYYTHWKRNDDPAFIRTFDDPGLNARIAGSTTIGRGRLSDRLPSWQLLAGAAWRLGDRAALDLKLRRVAGGRFESKAAEWDQLRSHDSTVGRGGPVVYTVATGDTGFWAAGLNLVYRL